MVYVDRINADIDQEKSPPVKRAQSHLNMGLLIPARIGSARGKENHDDKESRDVMEPGNILSA